MKHYDIIDYAFTAYLVIVSGYPRYLRVSKSLAENDAVISRAFGKDVKIRKVLVMPQDCCEPLPHEDDEFAQDFSSVNYKFLYPKNDTESNNKEH